MSAFFDSNDVWVLSRRKLQRAGADDSGDTLRRSVLIHNIIKQHSQPPSPVASSYQHHHHQPPSLTPAPQQPPDDAAIVGQDRFMFPSMDESHPYSSEHADSTSYSAGEEDWLDGLLHELDYDQDVHLSVLPVEDDGMDVDAYPLTSQPAPSLLPEQQSPLELLHPDTLRNLFYDPPSDELTSPPTSPPALMEHSVDSDDEDDEWDGSATTPPASTECLWAGQPGTYYFCDHSLQRPRPSLATHQFDMC